MYLPVCAPERDAGSVIHHHHGGGGGGGGSCECDVLGRDRVEKSLLLKR